MLNKQFDKCILKRKWIYLIGFILLFSSSLSAQNPFITTWKTGNTGVSNSTSINIPTHSRHTYLYDVDWEYDGRNFSADDTGVTGSISHDYGKPGTYTVAIRGDFPRIWFDNGGDKDKILEINQWAINNGKI